MNGSWLDRALGSLRGYPWRERLRAARGALIVIAVAIVVLIWAIPHRPDPPVPLSWRLPTYAVIAVVMGALLRLEDALDGEAPLSWWQYGLVGLAIMAAQSLVELTWGPRLWGLDLDAPVSFVFFLLVGWLRSRHRRSPSATADQGRGTL